VTSQVTGRDKAINLKTKDMIMLCLVRAIADFRGGDDMRIEE
jgi:hypothetical protein